ncbi:DUF192 domain-containing protein [Candidatus Woesebacteria bacterium]|nr:DUF192 domain-containing protein [Candidatus Woesebacteria bacterium]
MKSKSKNILPIFLILSLASVFVFLIISRRPQTNTTTSVSFPKIDQNKFNKTLFVGDNKIKAAIADDPEETRIGLSDTKELCEDCGMYFDLGYKDTIPTFWMKDMSFPIDIIWIDDGKIVDITKNIPAPEPGMNDAELPRYRPSHVVDNVLEVNAGYSDQLGIQIGDTIILTEK